MDANEMDRRYMDRVDPERNCPGFDLWDALCSDGNHYLVSADYEGSARDRVSMRSFGTVRVLSIVRVGPNPDRKAWEDARKAKYGKNA